MKIYAAGWTMATPALNMFKQFIRENAPRLTLAGIIYPKKRPDDLEGIPIIDFDDLNAGRVTLTQKNIILDCSAGIDTALAEQFNAFFLDKGITRKSIPDFLAEIIESDAADQWIYPLPGVRSSQFREFQATSQPSLLGSKLLDLESYEVARRLDWVLRSCNWKGMLDFDQADTWESVVLVMVENFYRSGLFSKFFVVDAPLDFLNILVVLRQRHPDTPLEVSLSPQVAQALGPRLEFYRRILKITQAAHAADPQATLLLGSSADAIATAVGAQGTTTSSLFFMERSLLDVLRLDSLIQGGDYRLMLRQPDTDPSHLIAILVAP